MKEPAETLEVIIIGGGPAGLSAALLLGRCRRKVAVFDEGRPRNFMSPKVHGYLGVPESSPGELLEAGRAQLARHPNVTLYSDRVEDVGRRDGNFGVVLKDGRQFRAPALVIATGLIDRLPDIEGLAGLYGTSVFPCPYCDGWENADRALGVLGGGNDAADLAVELLLWSNRVSLFIHGVQPSGGKLNRLEALGVEVYGNQAVRIHGSNGRITAVEVKERGNITCEALFLVADQIQHHDFLESMGCALCDGDQAECDDSGRTRTPGLFVAGNARKGLQMAIVAAADGVKCGAAANDWLLRRAVGD